MPEQNAPYGKCNDCGLVLATQEESRQHHMETLPEHPDESGRRVSHSTQVLNPSRQEKLASHIARIIEDALYQANEDLEELEDLDGGYTQDEIKTALRHHADFHTAYEEHLNA